MTNEVPVTLLVAGTALTGLWWSNFLFDSGISHWRSRKVGHFFGGCGILFAALLFKTWVIPVALSGLFALLLGIANKVSPRTFRGTGGTGRGTQAMSEVWFPLATMLVWLVGWGFYGRPLQATACILMMAWGDCIGGWVRAFRYTKATKGWEGSLATLGVCFLLAWAFLEPLWLGALTAVAATTVEYFSGDVSKVSWLRWADDNVCMPVIAAAVYFGGLYAIGLL
jgi:dolichol kinase